MWLSDCSAFLTQSVIARAMAFRSVSAIRWLLSECAWTAQAVVSRAAVCQLGCYVQNWQLRCTPFSPSAIFQKINWLSCSQSALLCMSFQLSCIMSAQLSFVRSATVVYSVCYGVLCHAIHLTQATCKASAQLESASSFANCHLSCNLSGQSWYVSLAAVCRLSLSGQLQHGSSAAMCLLSSAQLCSATIWRLNCNSSGQLSGQMQLVSWAAPCQLRWNFSSQLQCVGSAVVCLVVWTLFTRLRSVNANVFCQLGCDTTAQQSYVSSAVICQLVATRPVAVSSIPLVRVQGIMHSTSLIHHHQLRRTCVATAACWMWLVQYIISS